MRIAIIGAGMAGLAAGRKLRLAGHDVTIFDKSRGLGGRMATRRSGDLAFDHGAQYFTARGASFKAAVARWCSAGAASEWFEDSFVGSPTMTAPARDLAEGLAVVSNVTVTHLERMHTGWSVHGAEFQTSPQESFGRVVLATPAPQALAIATSSGLAFDALERASYAPCWALMLAFEQSTGVADRAKPEDATIGWMARNASKPSRDGSRDTIVVHATPGWSKEHLERSPPDAAVSLLEAFRRITGVLAEPVHMAAHRWRYALVETPAGVPCVYDETIGVGACGDWCLGARVEAAFDSGEAMADRLIASAR